ncbi:DMT family transporter [Kitasatospora kifunensis]|uniref:DME family drug/metabolite transporter n=1 Tax=Kitasatospora kifunensis TaxID=58351 RepID=A0A7W7VUE6_KITKI|nr:EamA family transporter [Kitasatospora kifunensis]MBB4922574.1 DME family drug/metabolite transporter [Kitasatospora kifunensis]
MSAGRGLLYLLLSAASWGTAGAAAALLYGASGLGPVALTFWRAAGGSALLLAVLAARRRRPAPTRRRPLARRDIAVNGLGLTLFQIGYFEAVHGTGLAVGTVVTLGAAPVLVALGACLLLREPLGGAGAAAVLGALAGLAVLMLGGATTVRPAGVAWALLSAAGYACITLYGRRSSANQTDALTTTLHSFLVCALVLLPFAAAEGLWPHQHDLGRTLLVLLYLAAVPTALGYALYFTGVTVVRATTAAVIALIEPVSATAIAVTALGEHLSSATVAGSAVLLLAVTALAVAETRLAVRTRRVGEDGGAARPGALVGER